MDVFISPEGENTDHLAQISEAKKKIEEIAQEREPSQNFHISALCALLL